MIVDTGTKEVVAGRFAKMFFDDIERLFTLTGTERAILDLMIRDSKLGGENKLNMTPARKKEYATIIGLKTYVSINNSLNKMVDKGILKDLRDPESRPYMFQINPEILFKGNEYQQARIIIEYSEGKRRVKAFPNAEKAEEWLRSNDQ